MTAESVEWIVEERVTFVWVSGERAEGRIAIAAPVQRELDCACAILVDGLDGSVRQIFGETKLQALVLALSFVGFSLHTFVERGGRLLQDGDNLPVAAVLGPLYRAPVAPSADGEEADD